MTYNDSMFLPPWNQWSNDFIKNENWDEYNDQTVFKHPGGHEILPMEIAQSVKYWKRPGEIFSADGLAVQTKGNTNDIDNLLTINEQLMNVKVYRWILYHIMLCTNRFKNKWPQPWHPSSLVFSRCKAEVAWNKKSKPEYNPYGKYWLKLFYMGKFRMICVSDHLPTSVNGRVLLPLCEDKKVLWLPLLVKGLLRIYSLTDKFDQFNTITCLTGWSCIQKNCQDIPKEHVWLSILSHSSNWYSDTGYLDSDSKQRNKKPAQHKDCFPIVTTESTQCHHDKTVSNYGSNPPNSIVITFIASPEINKDNNNSNTLNQDSQPLCLNFAKMIKNKGFPTWKKYRWERWAIDKSLIKDHELNDFSRLVNIYGPCTTMLNQTSPLMKVLNKYKSIGNDTHYELDFSYLEPFATCMQVYVKRYQSFPFVKSVNFQHEENPMNDIDLSTHNNCVYLHFESPYCQCMLFTLSVCKNYIIHNGNTVLDTTSDRHTIDYPYIIVEQFFWYETKLRAPLLTIRSRGVSNDVVKFQPGVNVLKISGELPAKYSLTIESTVDFSLYHTLQTVYEKLIDHPKSLTSFLVPIKQMFLHLCSSEPNSGDHGQNLLKFYSLFMPHTIHHETELKTIERISNISKQVKTAMVTFLRSKFSNDVHATTELFIELQELLQNKSLGLHEIFLLGFKQKPIVQKVKISQSQKKIKNEKSMMIKKSFMKSKINQGKSTPISISSKSSSKQTASKIIHTHMFEILCNVLHSDKIDLDEYHLKNDLFNYVISIIFDENTTKPIDALLLFRLELNTHSLIELMPTIIQFSNKNNNDLIINLTLIDNDTQLEVIPMNIYMNLFMAHNTTKGYTLLGWSSEKILDYKNASYKLEFFGRPYQVLHSCGTQKDHTLHKYNTIVCDNFYSPDFNIRHVKNKFYRPNVENLLARVIMNIENAAVFTVYCHLESLGDVMEIRIVDKNVTGGTPTVFASSRARGKTAMIPAVFLNPNNHYNSQSNDTETETTSTVFVIEVFLIKNIEIEYINMRNDTNEYDWTISCIYDKKVTSISLETDVVDYNFQYISSIPHQDTKILHQPTPILLKPHDITSETSNSNVTNQTDRNYTLKPNMSFHEMFQFMTVNQNLTTEQLVNNDSSESYSSFIEKNTALINKIKETTSQQNITKNRISSDIETTVETRHGLVDGLSKKVLSLLQIQRKSNMNVKQSRMTKKKSRAV